MGGPGSGFWISFNVPTFSELNEIGFFASIDSDFASKVTTGLSSFTDPNDSSACKAA